MARQTSTKISIFLIILAMIFTIGIYQELFAIPESCVNASSRCQNELGKIEKNEENSNLDFCGPLLSLGYFTCT